jgi:hypothetical protein
LGVGGKVSHCGLACAAVMHAARKKTKAKAKRRMAHLLSGVG